MDVGKMEVVRLPLLLIYSVLFCISNCSRPRSTRQPPAGQMCALFRSNDTVALNKGISTYIKIDDIDVGSTFSVYMDVLPSPLNHNGILLSVGSRPDFEYYEWKTKAVHTQFLVLEIIFSALALTVKANGTEHLQQIEVYRTWPTPYFIDDANWHEIKAYRDRENWILKMGPGYLNVTRPISRKTDVQLLGKTAFIGGRPGYTDHQFQGVIRNLRINGKPIQMSSSTENSSGLVTVVPCNSQDAQLFMNWIKLSKMHA